MQGAVDAGRRLAVRSGGHCLENLVDHEGVQSLIDLSALREVRYDPEHRAFSVQAGAELGPVYRALHLGWGVALPASTLAPRSGSAAMSRAPASARCAARTG